MSNNVKKIIARQLKKIHLYDFANFYFIRLLLLKRIALCTDKRIIKKYLRTSRIKKLQIGAGENFLEGWLNSDIDLRSDEKVYLDAKKSFPFEDSTFNYIFCEHTIEHLTYREGLTMLSECHRVLEPGGKIRIATPDLHFLHDLYVSNKSELQKKYLKWAIKKFNIRCLPLDPTTFIINNFFKAWGHKFIYDSNVLRYILENAGFIHIKRCHLNNSDDEELRRLENMGRMPPVFLELETMFFEATKPFKARSAIKKGAPKNVSRRKK